MFLSCSTGSVPSDLSIIRRKLPLGHAAYFIANLSSRIFDGFLELTSPTESAAILDPLTGKSGRAEVIPGTMPEFSRPIHLTLAPGQSLVVCTDPTANLGSSFSIWPYGQPAATRSVLAGNWSLTFTKGGPDLPHALTTTELKSWTDLGGDEAKRFGGTVRYRLEFDAPAAKADDWRLDLGDVRESARVRLNGRDLGTLWSIPFHVDFPASLVKPTGNILELDVTNLAANRIRDMDGANDPKPDASEAEKAAHPPRKADWKIMREINFVNINYRPFDASGWALTPSGLLGPVTLTPLRAFTP